ncbi:MAG: FecR domain-containing protein [Magnetococcales bacterium]|nr:FecR domain-containing protein [Magnetococcales bacterium]
MTIRRTKWRSISIAILLLGDGIVLADNPAKEEPPRHIGRVQQLTGQAFGRIDRAEPNALAANAELFAGEEITTRAQSSLTIQFRDGTTLSVGQDAKIILDHYLFNPTASNIQNTVQVDKGAFRFTSGMPAKQSHVNLKTPNIMIGVRGTVAEGVVDENLPTFIALPKGEGTLSNGSGSQAINEGEATAALTQQQSPTTADAMPAEVTAQAIQFLNAQFPAAALAPVALTEAQQLADAMANQATLAQQKMARKAPPPTTQGENPWLRWLIHRLVEWINTVIDLFDAVDRWLFSELRRSWQEVSWLQSAWAAKESAEVSALSLLVKAKSAGLLSRDPAVSKEVQQQRLQTFRKEAERQLPNAAAIIGQHQQQQSRNNMQNMQQSTGRVISNAAKVVRDGVDLAAIVHPVIGTSAGKSEEMVRIVISSALSVPGKTDNGKMAGQVVAAACQANPAVAATAASSAVGAIPPGKERTAASPMIAGIAAKLAPKEATRIASGVATVDKASASSIAAAVTAVAKEHAVGVATAIVQVVGAEKAAEVAAVVARLLPAKEAARLAGAVTRVAGDKAAAAIATAVAKVVVQESKEIVGSVMLSMENRAARIIAEVAVAVASATDKKDLTALMPSVAQATGVSMEQVKAAMEAAKSSPAVQEALAAVEQIAAKAEQMEKLVQEVKQQAAAMEQIGRDLEQRRQEADTPAAKGTGDTPGAAPASDKEESREPDNSSNKGSEAPTDRSSNQSDTLKQQIAQAVASGQSVTEILQTAMRSGTLSPEQAVAAAMRAGMDPGAVTQAAVALGGNAAAIVAAVIDGGGSAAAVAAAAIKAGANPDTVLTSALNAGGKAGEVAVAAMEAGGSSDQVIAMAMQGGVQAERIMVIATQHGQDTATVVQAMVRSGGNIQQIIESAVRTGADTGSVVSAAISAGADARQTVSAMIQSGGNVAQVAAAAVRAGANAGEIASGAISAGGDVGTVVSATIAAGGSVLDVVTAAGALAPNQVQKAVESAIAVGADPTAAQEAGAASRTQEMQPIQPVKSPSPS